MTGADAGAALPAAAGLGGSLALRAADIDFAGHIRLPSGSVSLTQTGSGLPGAGLRLADAAIIDVAGVTAAFGPAQVGSPGGRIALTAETGDIDLAGATLDVSSAAVGGGAGQLSVAAPLGSACFGPGVALRGTDPAHRQRHGGRQPGCLGHFGRPRLPGGR
mgnify:CR=1 FL=1